MNYFLKEIYDVLVKKYFKIPQIKKSFSPELIKKIKKYLFPYCVKHHKELHKNKRVQIKKF